VEIALTTLTAEFGVAFEANWRGPDGGGTRTPSMCGGRGRAAVELWPRSGDAIMPVVRATVDAMATIRWNNERRHMVCRHPLSPKY
jgi:hypothetical protein